MKVKTTNVLRLANMVRQNVQKKRLFNSYHNLLVTFSGGQDSAFCLLILYLLKNKVKNKWDSESLICFLTQYKKHFLIKPSTAFTLPFLGHIVLQTSTNKPIVQALQTPTNNLEHPVQPVQPVQNPTGFVTTGSVSRGLFGFVGGCTQVKKTVPKITHFLHKLFLENLCTSVKPLDQGKPICFTYVKNKVSVCATRKVGVTLPLVSPICGPKDGSVKSKYIFLNCSSEEFIWTVRQVNCEKASRVRTISPSCAYENSKGICKRGVVCVLVQFPFSSFFCARKKEKDALFREKKTSCNNSVTCLTNDYTLLWCNHFWQKDSFFTMEHVSKLNFCFCYTTHFFIPISKLLSEQNARFWRHQVTQRCLTSASSKSQSKTSFFIRQVKVRYNYVGPIRSSRVSLTESTLFYKPLLTTPFGNAKTKLLHQSELGLGLTNPYRAHKTVRMNLYEFVRVGTQAEFAGNSLLQYDCEQLCVQGHNKSDRAETILFNLIRGTGMNGISTLQWKRTFFFNSNSKFYGAYYVSTSLCPEYTYVSPHCAHLCADRV